MIDERPEALLKSALEKIVYFEARSEQLQNDLTAARGETDRLKQELATAAQREIELRRHVAELEVRISRGHQEREELSRVNDALRIERTDLLEKLIEASRIDAADRENMADMFDLAGFIAQLRGEVINGAAANAVERAAAQAAEKAALKMGDRVLSRPAAPAAPVEKGVPSMQAQAAAAAPGPVFSAPAPAPVNDAPTAPRAAANSGGVSAYAERLFAQGRLSVSESQMMALSSARTGSAARTEETLFGFSVRELAAPDPAARIRAAERLKSLQNPAAAHALATAIHVETDPEVQVALLGAFTALAQSEGAAIVAPLLRSPLPEVRISALKALLALDPTQAGPHLSAAMKDPNRAVRRRASLLALSLSGEAALKLGEEAIRDEDAEVRGLAALVLGAGSGEKARSLLLEALRDREAKVRQSAARALSRLLGQDISNVVNLEDAQRRREVRRLATLPLRPVLTDTSRPASGRFPREELVETRAAPREELVETRAVLREEFVEARVAPREEFVETRAVAREEQVFAVVGARAGESMRGAELNARAQLQGDGRTFSRDSRDTAAPRPPASIEPSRGRAREEHASQRSGSNEARPQPRGSESRRAALDERGFEAANKGRTVADARVAPREYGDERANDEREPSRFDRDDSSRPRQDERARNASGEDARVSARASRDDELEQGGAESARGGRGNERAPVRDIRGDERESVRDIRGDERAPVRELRGEREPVREVRGEREPVREVRGEREPVREVRGEREPSRGERSHADERRARAPATPEVDPLREEIHRRREPLAAARAEPVRAPAPVVAEELPRAARVMDEALCELLVAEVRCAIRGRTFAELTAAAARPPKIVEEACDLLVARGQVVRRGLKYFFA